MPRARYFAVPAYLVALAAISVAACGGGLLWSDEFAGPAGTRPSAIKWRLEEGDGTNQSIPGWGNLERQYYTAEAAQLDGAGHLVITARAAGATRHRCYYGPCRFTSARLISRFSGRYGRFEARLRVPAAAGAWPAFWMLGADIGEVGWPACGEIDVMEARGSHPDTLIGAVHGPGYAGGQALAHSYRLINDSFADGFHVVAMDWRPDALAWSVDGVTYGAERPAVMRRWVFDHPFYMLLNLAIGGNFAGQPAADVNFTATFVVDYVRVYGLPDNCTAEDPTTGRLDLSRIEVAKGSARAESAWTVVGLLVGLASRA